MVYYIYGISRKFSVMGQLDFEWGLRDSLMLAAD